MSVIQFNFIDQNFNNFRTSFVNVPRTRTMMIYITKTSEIAKAKARRHRKVLRDNKNVSKVWIVQTGEGWFYLID